MDRLFYHHVHQNRLTDLHSNAFLYSHRPLPHAQPDFVHPPDIYINKHKNEYLHSICHRPAHPHAYPDKCSAGHSHEYPQDLRLHLDPQRRF